MKLFNFFKKKKITIEPSINVNKIEDIQKDTRTESQLEPHSDKSENEKSNTQNRIKKTKKETNNADLYCGFGAHNQEMGNYEIAINQFNKALKENPKYDIVWNNLGNSYASLRKYEKSLECYQKAIECSPERFEFYYHKGILLMQLGRFTEAEPIMDKAIKLNSSNLDAMFNMATISENIKKYDQAAFFAQMCLKMSPNNPQIAQCFARNLYLQGTIESAYKQIDKYLTYPARDLNWYMVVPLALKTLNKENEIDQYFHRLNMKYNTSYFNWVKGIFYLNTKQKDLALEIFTENYNADPNDLTNLYSLTHLEYQNKNYSKALSLTNECILKGGDQRAYWDVRMRILEQIATEEEVYKEVLQKKSIFTDDPLNISFRYGLYLKSTVNKYEEAIKVFKEIDDPQSGWSNYQIGLCYNLLKNKEKCLAHLEKAFSIDRSCRDDAIFFSELDNLRDDKQFTRILTFFDDQSEQ